jgi:lysophospholipase L1-like esterase
MSVKWPSRRNIVIVAAFVAAVTLASRTQADEKKNPSARWEKTIQKFEQQDKQAPPKKGGVLFVGSSSIRMWKLDKSFPRLGAINRGFSGSEIADSIHFADRIIFKHKPRSIVLYAGDNDIAKGKSPKRVVSDFKKFVELVQEKSPQSKIAFIAIKPSISRWNLSGKMSTANAAIQKICDRTKNVDYVDIYKPMLGKDGKPRPSLFIKDGLHMSDEGYELWTSIIKPIIIPKKN